MKTFSTKDRIGFAVFGNNAVFQEGDERPATMDWLRDTFMMTDDEIEHTIRGGIWEDEIRLHYGTEYLPVDLAALPAKVLIDVLNKHREVFGPCPVKLYNGSVVGKEGDVWETIETVGTFTLL